MKFYSDQTLGYGGESTPLRNIILIGNIGSIGIFVELARIMGEHRLPPEASSIPNFEGHFEHGKHVAIKADGIGDVTFTGTLRPGSTRLRHQITSVAFSRVSGSRFIEVLEGLASSPTSTSVNGWSEP